MSMTKESVQPHYKIYVGNLAPHTNDHDLVRVFCQYGTVVEAVALSAKGFGFVHMASEEDGVRAMKSLYKYLLNGKEMVVQPAINPKKASVSQHPSRRATIGKGVSTLDDFDEYYDYETFLDQEIANCISESPPAPESSPAASFSSYSSSGNNPQQLQANSNNILVASSRSNEIAASSANQLSTPTAPRGSANPLVNGIPNYSNSISNPNIVRPPAALLLATPQSNKLLPARSVGSSAVWNIDTAPSVINSPLNSLAQSNNSHVNNTLRTLNSRTKLNGQLPEPFLNCQLKAAFPGQVSNLPPVPSIDLNNQLLSKIATQTNHLNQLQIALHQNPNNQQLLATIQKLQQEILMTRALIKPQPLESQLTNEQIENNILKLKQQELQRLVAHQQQQQQQQLLALKCGAVGGSNSIEQQLALNLPNLSTASLIPLSGISSSNLVTLPGINNCPVTSIAPNSLAMSTNNNFGVNKTMAPAAIMTTLANNMNANHNKAQSACGLCQETYNSSNRLPKILGCTHTFCLRCLFMISSPNTEVRCPGGCGVATQLSEAGVAGLTTNQGILTPVLHYSQANMEPATAITNSLNSCPVPAQVQCSEVCASCTGTLQDQPISKCREDGHTLVKAQDAMQLIVTQLKPLVFNTLANLREAMTLRAGIKERVESTLQSLGKFMDELKDKLHRDNTEESMLISTLNDLNCVHLQLERQSYPELVRTYHMVSKCSNEIKLQYNQCLTATCVNEAVKAMVLQIHAKSLANVKKLGLNESEVFMMDQTLQDHARVGNYANVLLQYMVADLLASRLSHSTIMGKEGLTTITAEGRITSNGDISNNAHSLDNMSSMPDSRSVASVSPIISCTEVSNAFSTNDMSNGSVMRSLTTSSTATPDITMNSHNLDQLTNNIDNMDINCVIQTTEAIEAENRTNSKTDISSYSGNAASLGLSNICHLVDSGEIIVESIDLEKSFLEGSACIEPDQVTVESSAPSPNSSSSITPPIVNNAARASVDSSAASSDSGIVSCKPFSYLDAAKKPAKPQPEPQPKSEIAKIPAQPKQIKTPHCWMKVTVDGKAIGRIVFQLRPDKAPKMCENFLGLCTGKPGYGYQGTHFFKNGDGFLAGGDVEYDDGSGGYSIYGKKKFEADLCPLKDEVGMIRFKGNGTSEAGRGMVGSQFMVWYAEREFKKFSYSLVFGRVVDGLDVVKKAANVNLAKHDVMIEESGGIM